MKILPFLLKKEFLQIMRNRTLIRLIIMLPLFQLAVLPWAATFDLRDIPLSVVDNDHSSFSRRLTDKITASGFFKLVDYSPSHARAEEDLQAGRTTLILDIPAHFEKDFVNGRPPKLMVSLNAVNGQEAGLGYSYIGQIINRYNSELNAAAGQSLIVDVRPYYRFNPEMSYHNYMVPGVIVLLLSVLVGMMSAMNIVSEKEIGTIEQMNVTPVPKYSFILGKLIPFWVIGLLLLTLGITIARLIYGLVPEGSIAAIYVFSFFYLLAFTGLGLLVSNFAKTQQQAMFVILFFLIIFILISGLFTPISSMPDWAQKLTWINPIRYFVEVMRLVYLKGSGLPEIMPQLLKMIVFVLVINTAAIISYRKTTG